MKQILIATHGKMASGIRYTAELIVGKMAEITTIDAYVTPEDNVEKKFEEYFNTEALRGFILQPLVVTGLAGKIDVNASVSGGGKAGQAGAVRHGIARALVKHDEEACKSVLKASGMLTRDAREKERKKPGQPGARKRFQFSKR